MSNSAELLEKLKDSNPGLRRKSVRELSKFPEKEVVEALCNALGDPNKGVQNITIEALSSMRHENVVYGLIPVVKSSDLNTRNSGMTILRNLGTMAIKPLEKALKESEDNDEIIQILVVLGDIKSPLATDTILGYINHEDDNVKTTAVESLGKIQDPKAVDPLIEAYKTTDILKYSIVEALGNIGVERAAPILFGALDSEDILEYFTGIGAIGALESPRGIEPLFAKLQKEDDSGTRRLIFKSLSQIEVANPGLLKKLDKDILQPALKSLLENVDSAEYKYLIQVAASLNDADYATDLLKALESAEAEISDIAFNGLIRLGAGGVKPALEKIGRVEPPVAVKILSYLEKNPSSEIPQSISLFAQNPDDSLRQALAKTLGVNPSNISFNTLKELLDDPDEVVRINAVIALRGMLDYDGALTALIGKFKDINGHVRREAASSMRFTKSSQVIEPLFDVITSEPYGDVREAAASVLSLRKDPEITKRLLQLLESDNSRLRETVSKTIWQCGSTIAVDTLIHKLEDKEWRVVVNSCKSLENMKDLKSIFPLKELLKNDDWQIKIAALSALRAFGSKELKQFFVPLLSNSNSHVAKLAVVALSEIGDKSLDKDFQKYLDHQKWEVRYQIVKALGNIKCVSSADVLLKIAEKDENNAVRAKALFALAKIKNSEAIKLASKTLDSEDVDLVITAIKFFNIFEEAQKDGIKEKIINILFNNIWVKNYFIRTFNENKSDFLKAILSSVVTPREYRAINKIAEKDDSGMTDGEALLISDIIAEKCGIIIQNKNELKKRLQKSFNRFFITSWSEYYYSLRYGVQEEDDLFIALYDSITNPSTEFFGDADQAKVMTSVIIPELIDSRASSENTEIKILDVGCSFGPEAYSTAMIVLEEVHSDRSRVSVTGIDISHICLNTAKRGIYKSEMFRLVDQKYIDLYLEDDRGDLRVQDKVKNLVEFKYANAINSSAMEELGEFDIVICRNVFSSFSQKGKERLAENIYNVLKPGGVLFIAADESLYNVTKAFRLQTHERVVAYKKL